MQHMMTNGGAEGMGRMLLARARLEELNADIQLLVARTDRRLRALELELQELKNLVRLDALQHREA